MGLGDRGVEIESEGCANGCLKRISPNGNTRNRLQRKTRSILHVRMPRSRM